MSRPLHIGLIYWDPFTPGGVQSQIAGRLNSLGFLNGPVRFTLFSKRPPPPNHPWPHVRTVVFHGWDRFSIAWSEYTAARSLRRKLTQVHKSDPFDLIDLHAGGAGQVIGSWSKKTGVPYVFVSHSIRFFSFPNHGMRWELSRYYAWANRKAASGAQRVLAVSNALKEEWIRFGVPSEHINVLRTATTDPPQVWNDSANGVGPLRLLFVGRTQRDKGLDVLVEAVKSCRIRPPGPHLSIVGEIPLDHPVRKICGDASMNVEFLGTLPNDTARRMMAESDVLVIPSRYDPCPVVAIEGLAAGALIVASNVGGLPEQINDGKTGLLVPPNDPNALSAVIERIAADPGSLHSIRQAAREAGRKNLWSYRAPQILTAYEQHACQQIASA